MTSVPRDVDLQSAGLRPRVLRWINAVSSGKKPLDAGKLIDRARRETGLRTFDDEWDDTPLRVLVDAINSESELSAVGRFIMRQRLANSISVRLRGHKILTDHPGILEDQLAPIWLITGLQRTGTTYLQRLLSSDPDARALLSWESLDPVPRGDRFETKRRIRHARLSEKALAWISPGFFAIHPIDHSQPEEDVLLLDPTFYSSAPEAILNVPSFAAWLERADHTLAYRWERKMLLLLQWQRPASRWILKSPHHLEHLETFHNVFPETESIIWTHRNPRQCLPSFLSMVYHGRAMFSENRDVEVVRKHWLRKSGYMVDSALRARDALPAGLMYDVNYEDLVANPMLMINKLYRDFGMDVDGQAKTSFESEIAKNQKNRFGRHVYSGKQFGVTDAMIEMSFRDYHIFLQNRF